MPKPTIFVSHSHHDNDWCRQFVAALQRLGYDVWYDEKGLAGGVQWVRTIERELESRAVFTIILTPQSWESDWVQLELQLALTTQRRVIPILLDQTDISGFLRTYQRISAENVAVDTVATEFDAAVSPAVPTPPAGDSAREAAHAPDRKQQGSADLWTAKRQPYRTRHLVPHTRAVEPQVEKPRLVVVAGHSQQKQLALKGQSNVLESSDFGFSVFDSDMMIDSLTIAVSESSSQHFEAIIARQAPESSGVSGWFLRAFSHSIKVNGELVAYGTDYELLHSDLITIQDDSVFNENHAVTFRLELE